MGITAISTNIELGILPNIYLHTLSRETMHDAHTRTPPPPPIVNYCKALNLSFD